MRRVHIFDLSSPNLPRRIREVRKKLKFVSMIGRVDLSRSLVPYGRTETAWMKRIREHEEHRRNELEK